METSETEQPNDFVSLFFKKYGGIREAVKLASEISDEDKIDLPTLFKDFAKAYIGSPASTRPSVYRVLSHPDIKMSFEEFCNENNIVLVAPPLCTAKESKTMWHDAKMMYEGYLLASKGEEKETKILKIYNYQAETVENALRLCANTLNSHSKETCLDRDVMQAWSFIKNVLTGEIDKEVKRF